MEQLTDDEIKKVTLGIMKEVKRVCSFLDLQYFLAWGTLLGAIRHKGFIPWDDDADFLMFRNDYEHLILRFNDIASSKYRLLAPGLTPGYYYTFAKVIDTSTIACETELHEFPGMGIWLDLFPLDYLPATQQGVASQDSMIGTYLKRRFIAIWHDYRFLGKFWSLWEYMTFPSSERTRKMFSASAAEICFEFNQEVMRTKEVDVSCLRTAVTTDYKVMWDAADFSASVDISFEDDVFSAPVGYANILEQSYGDYMTPPPMRKRNEKHYRYAYWRE